MTDERLCAEIMALAAAEKAAGALMFMEKPDRWYEAPHWRCRNGHVSTMFLKTDAGDKCLECRAYVFLTFPEDVDGPLRPPAAPESAGDPASGTTRGI